MMIGSGETPVGIWLLPVFGACTVFAAALVYRCSWRRLRSVPTTPTGFGVLLGPLMLVGAVIGDTSSALQAALCVVAITTLIYWLDDLIELKARVRILLSFIVGGIVVWIYFSADLSLPLTAKLALCGAGGCLNVALTNMVNFYDGADLNLATFIALTACLLLAFPEGRSEWAPVAIAALVFTIPFAILNSKPNTIYIGDSGSFAFASLLTTLAVAFLHQPTSVAPESALPAALPALDVFVVFIIRIRENHDLLTRNYLHLYQRLAQQFRNFGYLAPQPVGLCLSLLAVSLLQFTGAGRLLAVLLSGILVTVPFYFGCRAIFLQSRKAPST